MTPAAVPAGPQHSDDRLKALAAIVGNEVHRQTTASGLPVHLREIAISRAGQSGARTGPGVIAVLPLAVYEAVSGQEPFHAAPAGAAMSLLIAAGDLLDDLQDNDVRPEDVGGATGAAEMMAVLLALSNNALHAGQQEIGLSAARLGRATGLLASLQLRALGGQADDVTLSGLDDFKLEDALKATLRKSGGLGRCAAMLGAAVATDDDALIDTAGRFGENLGVARQLLNDIAGVIPGGPPSTDIALGRKTAPIAFALSVDEAVNPAAGRVRSALSGTPEQRTLNSEDIRRDIQEAGGVSYAWILARVHATRARQAALELCRAHPAKDPSWLIEMA